MKKLTIPGLVKEICKELIVRGRTFSVKVTETGCHEIINHRAKSRGYSVTKFRKKMFYLHRLAWESAHGNIPHGLCVLHTCDNRACVNVSHLFLGTIADNNHDRNMKGRNAQIMGERNPMSILTEHQVKQIHLEHGRGVMQKVIAESLGVSRTIVCQILSGKRWRHLLPNKEVVNHEIR